MLRVVVDANVIVSGLISSKGPSSEIIKAWEEKKIAVLITKPILDEICEVLERPSVRKYHHLTTEEIQEFCSQIEQFAVFVKPASKSVKVPIDPDDIMFLDCALSGQAEFLVTGDKELLALEKFGETKIVNPANFLKAIRLH